MFDLMMWLVAIPVLVMSVKFWIRAAKYCLKNKRDISHRVQRARSAFGEGMQGAEGR